MHLRICIVILFQNNFKVIRKIVLKHLIRFMATDENRILFDLLT